MIPMSDDELKLMSDSRICEPHDIRAAFEIIRLRKENKRLKEYAKKLAEWGVCNSDSAMCLDKTYHKSCCDVCTAVYGFLDEFPECDTRLTP